MHIMLYALKNSENKLLPVATEVFRKLLPVYGTLHLCHLETLDHWKITIIWPETIIICNEPYPMTNNTPGGIAVMVSKYNISR